MNRLDQPGVVVARCIYVTGDREIFQLVFTVGSQEVLQFFRFPLCGIEPIRILIRVEDNRHALVQFMQVVIAFGCNYGAGVEFMVASP